MTGSVVLRTTGREESCRILTDFRAAGRRAIILVSEYGIPFDEVDPVQLSAFQDWRSVHPGAAGWSVEASSTERETRPQERAHHGPAGWGGEGTRLTEVEELRMVDQARRVASCGSSWAVMRGRGEGDPERSRIQVLRCGQRGCVACGREAREHAQKRCGSESAPLRFPGLVWSVMVTLTYPRAPHWDRSRGCWQNPGIDGEDSDWTPENCLKRTRENLTRWWEILRKRRQRRGYGKQRKDPRLQYAWAIEMHPDSPEWPHVHLVLSLPWPPTRSGQAALKREMRQAWRHVLAVDWVWIDADKVRDHSAGARYLTKYIAKQEGWSPELLAVMYRRRMWSTSLPVEGEELPPEWEVERIVGAWDVVRLLETRTMRKGWRIVSESREGWMLERDPEGARDEDHSIFEIGRNEERRLIARAGLLGGAQGPPT